jgi:twitching motility protein PilT
MFAAMINHINRTQHKHIVTIENPIEFLHRDINSSVTQRDVGVDTESYSIGLAAALRQDPDVVLIGEIRDAETLDSAVKGAEMGHLVIAAMPSPDAAAALGRLLAMFPREERQIGRLRLADALRAVISQQLLARKSGEGRVAAMEIVVATPAVREAVRDSQGLGELEELIEAGGDGMSTLEQHVVRLVEGGIISPDTARAAVPEPEALPLPADGKSKKKSKS